MMVQEGNLSGPGHGRWYRLLRHPAFLAPMSLLLSIAIFLVCVWLYLLSVWPDPVTSVDELVSDNGSHRLYVRRIVWGFTSTNDYTVISMSQSPPFSIDSTKDYVFHKNSGFTYRFLHDTLTVYLLFEPADVPPEFDSPIIVQQVPVTGIRLLSLRDSLGQNGLGLARYPTSKKKHAPN